MRIALFTHSITSDWGHPDAHFLRGVVAELHHRGHEVRVLEPRNAWSLRNLVRARGHAPLRQLRGVYPELAPTKYDPMAFDLDEALDGVRLVLVHELNSRSLVRSIGDWRARAGGRRALYHVTHHRSVVFPDPTIAHDLADYDGVLAAGSAPRDAYVSNGRSLRGLAWRQTIDPPAVLPHPARAAARGG